MTTETQTILKASELRIGNYIQCKGYYFKITSLRDNEDFTGSFINYEKISESDNPPEPIPLTPEILEKAGFTRVKNTYFGDSPAYEIPIYGNDHFLCVAPSGDWDMWHGDRGYAPTGSSEVTSVHQLQNLYFALTGNELQINL